jgi:5'(3')-deoxyribonucleotidase
MIFCGSKAVIKTDYMIDDHCKNLDYCIVKPILFHASHNVNIKHHLRVNNWQEVLEYFEKEEQGEKGA